MAERCAPCVLGMAPRAMEMKRPSVDRAQRMALPCYSTMTEDGRSHIVCHQVGTVCGMVASHCLHRTRPLVATGLAQCPHVFHTERTPFFAPSSLDAAWQVAVPTQSSHSLCCILEAQRMWPLSAKPAGLAISGRRGQREPKLRPTQRVSGEPVAATGRHAAPCGSGPQHAACVSHSNDLANTSARLN